MKKYLILGLVLATMFTGISCGSNAKNDEGKTSNMLEKAKIALASDEYDKARNLFKLASDEVEGKSKEEALVNYNLLHTFVLAKNALADGDIEAAKIELAKIEKDNTYENLVKDIQNLKKKIQENENLDLKIEDELKKVSNFLEEEKLEEAKKIFDEINLEGLSEEANKKYSQMSISVKKLEEKLADKKKLQEAKEKEETKKKEEKTNLFNGRSKLYIDYEDAGANDSFESFGLNVLESGELEVKVGTEKACPTGKLRKISEGSWTGSLYDGAFGVDYFYDVVATSDAIKVIQSSDENVRTIIFYLESKTYKSENTNSEMVDKGSFSLK